MSEAPEKIWATFEPHESGKGHPRTYATAQKTKGQEYVRSDIAEREIAELRDHCNAMEVEHRQAIEEMQSALADKARLAEALAECALLSGLDNELIEGASVIVTSRMAEIHQHSSAALASEQKS